MAVAPWIVHNARQPSAPSSLRRPHSAHSSTGSGSDIVGTLFGVGPVA
jgi:hypothetical protein